MLQSAFLHAILEQPDDEVARLAYADWLMEQDDPAVVARGEFIQVQCRLARWEEPLATWDACAAAAEELPRLRRRERELLAAHGAAWGKPLAGLAKGLVFCRGFVEGVTMKAADFLKHAARLFELAPVREVRLLTRARTVTQLAGSPHLARLSGLDLTGNSIGYALPGLLTSPHLGALTRLTLNNCRLSDWGAYILAYSPRLAQLTHLDLGNNDLTLGGVRALLSSRYCRRLRAFNVAGNRHVGQKQMAQLSAAVAGRLDPAGLQAILGLVGGPEQEFNNRHTRALVEQAAANAVSAVTVLQEGLRDSRHQVRAVAAQQLGRLGVAAVPALPGLVRRLYESDAALRGAVAPTLARLVPVLPPELQGWLCLLANPLCPAEVNLHHTLTRARPLPDSVGQAFREVCVRRVQWRAQHAGQDGECGNLSLREAVRMLLDQAGQAAVKHRSAGRDVDAARWAGRNNESAWLLARLCGLLQATGETIPRVRESG